MRKMPHIVLRHAHEHGFVYFKKLTAKTIHAFEELYFANLGRIKARFCAQIKDRVPPERNVINYFSRKILSLLKGTLLCPIAGLLGAHERRHRLRGETVESIVTTDEGGLPFPPSQSANNYVVAAPA